MYINPHILKIIKIAILTLTGYLSAEMLPENGSVFNYTQIFFRWEQIPDAESYVLSIKNVSKGIETEIINSYNSNLVYRCKLLLIQKLFEFP